MSNAIKFLKVIIRNHPLFEKELEFSLVTEQRVLTEDQAQLTRLFGNNWVNNITTIVGRNATGKTTVLKAVVGILSFLLTNRSIDQTRLNEVLLGDEAIEFETYFFSTDNKIYQDCLVLVKSAENKWHVASEKIFVKSANRSAAKKDLFDFSKGKLVFDRSQLDEFARSVLSGDDSLFRSVLAKEKYQVPPIIDTLQFTNVNLLAYPGVHVPGEILSYLDPTIEYLKIERLESGQRFYRLKFKGRAEEITDNNFATIELYLSSGTAKGITLYAMVLSALSEGGIIFVDELENHFNHAIVSTFLEYFINEKININRATIIFSTHYSELLDDLKRGDQIYVARRSEKIDLTRYSQTDIRSDISKTEVFDADNLRGTAPEYNAYIALRKATTKVIADGK